MSKRNDVSKSGKGKGGNRKGASKPEVKAEAPVTAEAKDAKEETAESEASEPETDQAASEQPVLPSPTREMTAGAVPATRSLKIEKDRPSANGYTRPSIGGICRTIWDACDRIFESGQQMPTAKQLALQLGVNASTVGRQSAEWRKFRGLGPKRASTAPAAE